MAPVLCADTSVRRSTHVPQRASRGVMLTLLFCVIYDTAVTILFYGIVGSPIPV